MSVYTGATGGAVRAARVRRDLDDRPHRLEPLGPTRLEVVEDPYSIPALDEQMPDQVAADEATTAGYQPAAHAADASGFHRTRGRIRDRSMWSA